MNYDAAFLSYFLKLSQQIFS